MEDTNVDTHSDVALSSTRSIIDEIKAQDIYTIYSPNKGPTLPNVGSCYGSLNCETCREPGSKIFGLKCRSAIKKLSIQQMKRSYLNLPAVIEEELPGLTTKYSAIGEIDDCLYLHDARTLPSKSEIETLKEEESNFDCAPDNENFDDDDGSSVEVIDDDESWVDLSKHTQSPLEAPSTSHDHSSAMSHTPTSPDKVAPLPFGNGEEYLRLLREAQKESNQSSARVSHASSRRDTPRDSPKSPPNSPNTEMIVDTEETPFKGVYINYYNRDGDFVRVEKNIETDWIWDWSSRPDQTPPKEWRFVHPKKSTGRGASLRRLMVGNSRLFSRDVLYTLLLTNVLSLLLGTGIGIWLSKKYGGSTVTISTIPIN